MDGDLLFDQTIGINNSQITLQVGNSIESYNKYRLKRVMERNALVVGSINLLNNLRVIYRMFVSDVVPSYLLNNDMGLDNVCY